MLTVKCKIHNLTLYRLLNIILFWQVRKEYKIFTLNFLRPFLSSLLNFIPTLKLGLHGDMFIHI